MYRYGSDSMGYTFCLTYHSMNTTNILIILTLVGWMATGITIIVHDYHKYHTYYCRKRTVVLKMNNEYVRKILQAHGYSLDASVFSTSSHLLYSPDGEHIYGYAGEYRSLVQMLRKNRYKTVNCEVSLGYFVYALHHQNLPH